MSQRVLLTILCAPADADAIATAVHDAGRGPVHLRSEQVRGRDFSDARTAELVGGALDRRAIELVVDAVHVEALIEQAAGTRRRQPIRWRVVPVLTEGRAP